jgi:hypothetical protein
MSLPRELLQIMLDEVSDQKIYLKIKDYDTWSGLLSQMGPSHPKPAKKELIEYWMRKRWDSLRDDLPTEAVESDGKLVVHRCIGVKDPEAFVDALRSRKKKARSLGVYWSYSFETAECYWGRLEGTEIIMTGLVDLDAINIPETVFANFHPDVGEQEREIRLKKGAPVLLTSVSLDEHDPRWQFEPGLLLRA